LLFNNKTKDCTDDPLKTRNVEPKRRKKCKQLVRAQISLNTQPANGSKDTVRYTATNGLLRVICHFGLRTDATGPVWGAARGVTTDRSTTIVPEYAKMGKTFLVYG